MAAEQLTFKSEGLALNAWLQFPDSGVAKVGVVCVTGGAVLAKELYSEWQGFFAEHGIASLAFDARGRGGSEGEYEAKGQAPILGAAYNTLYSRGLDTVSAIQFLRTECADLAGRVAALGSSMGWDAAIKAGVILARRGMPVDALVGKGGAAYHPFADDLIFGDQLRSILQDNVNTPGTDSANFRHLADLNVPTQKIYARNDQTITKPRRIQDLYLETIRGLSRGEGFRVGDEATGHGYFREDNPTSRAAKLETFERSAGFLIEHLG